ncbi:VOC family protein [Candidatus Gottesmanbacteria bacterium]|nr:VOC family protein [Candidatus Gottesmanbacteria bacterium]
MKLDVIELHVNNWHKSLDWWVNKLGLKIIVQEDDHKFALLLGTGGAMVGLYGGKPTSKQRFVPHFKVVNLEETVEKLKHNAIHVDTIEIRHWGKQAKVTDPEENIFYLYQEERGF